MEQSSEYEYVNEGLIDGELKCSICFHPFLSPISTNICGHTFCQKCIEKWLIEHDSCPECHRRVTQTDFTPIVTRVILNLLNRLHVQCILCRETNIERINFNDHLQKCINRTIPCSALDLGCTWTGPQHELTQHERTCTFRSVQPLVDELRAQKRHLQQTVQRQAEQIRFLLILRNNGKPLSENCTRDDKCRVYFFSRNDGDQPRCGMCYDLLRHIRVSVHHCDGECVCTECFRKYYPS